ncbi:unnamed protein product [Cladocopium goreaui]|uniref:Uncharacterized protein n=1 Tax=Cladocopium goreaui TaxID=2562237 RepID=A0A9P1BHA9_9DINO|nr:unnamed protein product [Cladocopium goreaui]
MVRLRPPSSMSNVVPRLQIWWMIALWCQLAAGVREPVKSQDIDEKAEILKPLNPKEMKDVFGLMEERYNFLGLQKALEALALQKVAGRTWHLGFPESRVHEKSLKEMSLPQSLGTLAADVSQPPTARWHLGYSWVVCVRGVDGELEEHLDFQTAREIYAGVCSLNTRHIHQKALVIMALLVDAWTYVSVSRIRCGRCAITGGSVGPARVGEDAIHRCHVRRRREAFAWNLQWGTYFTQTLEFPADLKMVPTVEWTQMVLQSVVMPEGGEVWSLFWHKGATISTTGLAFWRSDSHPQPRVR